MKRKGKDKKKNGKQENISGVDDAGVNFNIFQPDWFKEANYGSKYN